MSNDSTVWTILPENSTEVPPGAIAQQDSYVLLLVILSIFLVGTLIFIFVLLIACRHCFQDGGRYARASDDPEKTNTTYMEETQPTHEITIRVDEFDCLSMASSHDQETERFLSVGTMGRRVSFNEAALFDHSKKAQEKGRRYTLTEGDFHHLKNARLTHLHIPPPALKIVTIPECDSAENTITMATRPATKSALSIFQPMLCPLPQTALTSLSISPSSALPGDALNSVVDTSFSVSPSALTTKETSSSSLRPRIDLSNLLTHSLHEMEMMGAGPRGRVSPSSLSVCEGTSVVSGVPPGGGPEGSKGPVMQFFTKLRRHASLEGASPYFKIKKWKLDSSQRASSLDTRGSPKRRQFQRQRAASESMDQDDKDTQYIDLIQYIARTQDITYCPGRPTSRFLSPPSTPPPSLGRLEVEVTVEPSCSHGGPGVIGLSPEPRDEAPTLAAGDAADPPEPPDTQDTQALYRDIWMLRASLEQCATSDNSSNNDRSSVCSDVDSVCSLGTRGDAERTDGPPSHLSQDAADEAEGGGEGWGKRPGRGSVDSETGSRKLLQMDSGYASIEAPWPRGPDEPKDRTATEKRRHFTSAGRTGTVGDSLESHLSEEEPEPEERASGWSSPYGQMFSAGAAVQLPPPPPLPPPPSSPHRRDYSIDEKTDALFHQFLRHDPRFDLQESPLKKHRSRVHMRKQWQRHKQWSDPGVPRRHASFERQRTPLRRGDSVNCPLDASYHAALPRIVSTPDDDAVAGSVPEIGAQQQPVSEREGGSRDESRQHRLPPDEYSPAQHSGYGPQTITAELTDKLTSTLDDRLYTGLRRARDVPGECVTVTVTHASPDHSPV